MNAIIVTGGIGDVLVGLQAGMLIGPEKCHIFVNSHKEILDFVQKCTYFHVLPCPERQPLLPDAENPLNLPRQFLKGLHQDYQKVYSCFPDGLGLNPFAFPWYQYVKSYKEFLRVKIPIKVNVLDHGNAPPINVFCNFTSVTLEKNWPLPKVQKFVDFLNKTRYNVIIARTSGWKGVQIPFFCVGKYYDLVDLPIETVVNALAKCNYFVGIDSGLAHIAYHLGIPRVVLQRHFNTPWHIVRWQNETDCCLPLEAGAEMVLDRLMLNLRNPITVAIPSNISVPALVNAKQMLIQKYYA